MDHKNPTSSSSLYPPLPSHIQNNPQRLDLKPLEGSAQQYVESYLKRSLPTKQTKNYKELDNTLKTKAMMLDTTLTVKKRKKKKSKSLSAKQKKALDVYKIAPENQKFDLYLPLHELWKDYVRELLNLNEHCNMKQIYGKLLKADFHGCMISVCRSKCPSYIGQEGIVVQERKNIFKIITKNNQLKSIPKANSVFTFDLDKYEFKIYGSQFCYRPADRASRKYKHTKPTTDL